MRLLLTTDTVGGVWTFSRELTLGLLDAGHSVALVSLGGLPSSDQQAAMHQLTSVWPSSRFLFHASDAPLEWMQQNDQAYAAAEPLLLETVRSFAPDLLHVNQFCFGCLPVSQPRLITAHSDVLSWAASCRQKPLEPSPWLNQYIHLVSRGLSKAAAVVAPTHASLSDLARHWPDLPKQHVIHNGRSLSLPAQTGRKLQAVTAGRLWDEAKNIASLAAIDTPLPILIAGRHEGSPSHTMPLPPTLSTTGYLSEPDLLRLFCQSSIYLAPALYEPFGLAPLEAALCGCALILHDLPSYREVWSGHATFYRSHQELQQLLQVLSQDPARLAQQQHLAQQRAAEFSRTRMTQHYLALYQSFSRTSMGVSHVA